MHPHNVSAVENTRGNCCCRGEQCFFLRTLGEKRLARRPDQDRTFEARQLPQMRQYFGVLLFTFAEAEAGIDHNARPFHTRTASAIHGRFEFTSDGVGRIG